MGTIRAVTDIYGSVVARYAYEPFGSLTATSGPVDGELHRFTGKPSDMETRLSYFNARYYDPTLGRFTSSDPARDGLNWFVYCVSEPLSRSDPSGKNVKLQDYLLDVFHKIIEKAGAWLGFGPGVQSTPQMQGSNVIGHTDKLATNPQPTVVFKEKTIIQNNNLFDPYFIDTLGRTNIDRMKQGKAPIGYDLKPVNIHHVNQTDDGILMEILQTDHNSLSNLHNNTGQYPSQINRYVFSTWRNEYWEWRSTFFTQ